jgi:hypothetical protein
MNVEIDFDDSSKEWRKNKINVGQGCFKYKCSNINCNEVLYVYTTENKKFNKFASTFDLIHKNNPNKYLYCEEHLLSS